MKWHRSPHSYMLQFYTGSGRHDGTTANVFCCLHGNKRQTKPIVLRDPNRLLFQRGTLSSFLVTFNHSLDQIKRIHIWHDIAGPDPPWFLERVVVCHLNTGLTWYFEANRWLDVSQGDGTVECILEPETRKSLLASKRLFDRQLADNFRNKHMWFSPFLVKERTKFSRCQRVGCCGCLLGMSVLLVSGIIQATSEIDIFLNGFFRLGPMRIAHQEILIACACACAVFIFRILLGALMRKGKRNSDLFLGEMDVRRFLEHCKEKRDQVVFLDGDQPGTDGIPQGSQDQADQKSSLVPVDGNSGRVPTDMGHLIQEEMISSEVALEMKNTSSVYKDNSEELAEEVSGQVKLGKYAPSYFPRFFNSVAAYRTSVIISSIPVAPPGT